MHARICRTLSDLAAKHRMRVLFAVESGSRAWGLASPDSDYDVRGVFVAQSAEAHADDAAWRAAGLPAAASVPDDIVWMSTDRVVDVNLWSVPKLLRLLRGGNSVALEWARSPIVYWVASSAWPRTLTDLLVRSDPRAALAASRAHFVGLMHNAYSAAVKDARFDSEAVRGVHERAETAIALVTQHKSACLVRDWDAARAARAALETCLVDQEADVAARMTAPRAVKAKKLCYPLLAALNVAYIDAFEALPPLDANATLAALAERGTLDAPLVRAFSALIALKRAGAEAERAPPEELAAVDALVKRLRAAKNAPLRQKLSFPNSALRAVYDAASAAASAPAPAAPAALH